MGTRRAERSSSILRWAGQVIAWAVITAVVALLTVAVIVPRAVGATPYTIVTSSMEPSMPPGTLVVVEPVDPDEISVGDVVTYQLQSGNSTVVTHRVVSAGTTMAGEQVFQTQGDANDSPDTEPVRPVQIRGERLYFVPYVGRITSLVTSSQRDVVKTVVVLGLFGYAGSMFVGAAVQRRRSAGAPAPTEALPLEEVSA
jgi:signal peptidase